MSEPRSHRVRIDDLSFHTVVRPGSDPTLCPCVILHGFTGSTVSMAPVAEEVGRARTTVSIDLIGHGGSEAPDDLSRYSMSACCRQLAKLLEHLDFERSHLLGYSMGGRVALSFCSAYPQKVASCLLIGTSTGLTDPEMRSERIRADEALALRIEEDGIEPFVDAWMSNPLFASQRSLGHEALSRAREERLANRPGGLASSLRGMGSGAMPPIALARISTPLCFVAGALDPKFSSLAREYAVLAPHAQVEIVKDAGHAVHLEQLAAFSDVARNFFSGVDRDRAEGLRPHVDSEPRSNPPNAGA